jgi:hypothetical protein
MSICFGPRLAYSTDLISSNLFLLSYIKKLIRCQEFNFLDELIIWIRGKINFI